MLPEMLVLDNKPCVLSHKDEVNNAIVSLYLA